MIALSNNASIAAGMNGVDEAVGVSLNNAVSVIVGVDVMVGVIVIVTNCVFVGVNVGVGDGGKYS